MMDWLNSLDPRYAWMAIGLILAAAEMAAPGVFLIWLAVAALLTGLLCWLVPLTLPLQIVLFAVLSIVSVFLGKRFLRSHPVAAADPLMNDRGARLVGETVIITQGIEGGSGRAKHGDSEWMVKGADAASGTRMRVSGHQGTVLLVEHLN